jgi:polypeptide N-acetylgalactosaminyltransferase
MNIAASDEISLDRSIPDVRMQECQYWNYPANLPKVNEWGLEHEKGQ